MISKCTVCIAWLCQQLATRRSPDRVDRRIVCAVMLAAWMLWQEIQFLDQPGAPSWYLDGRFSGEAACHEARRSASPSSCWEPTVVGRRSSIGLPSRTAYSGSNGRVA